MHIAENIKLISENPQAKIWSGIKWVKSLLKIEIQEDFFEEVNAEDLAAIDEALEQLRRMENSFSHDSVREVMKKSFQFLALDFIYPYSLGQGRNRIEAYSLYDPSSNDIKSAQS